MAKEQLVVRRNSVTSCARRAPVVRRGGVVDVGNAIRGLEDGMGGRLPRECRFVIPHATVSSQYLKGRSQELHDFFC